MEYKVLEKDDVFLMKNFIDDENTNYNEKEIFNFLEESNSYGFIIKKDNEIIGFSYGYVLLRPDGKRMVTGTSYGAYMGIYSLDNDSIVLLNENRYHVPKLYIKLRSGGGCTYHQQSYLRAWPHRSNKQLL
jgi:hypothetical protein